LSSSTFAALLGVACVAGFASEAAAQAETAPLTRDVALARALADDRHIRCVSRWNWAAITVRGADLPRVSET
jgi:hypothetical protein